MIVTLVLTRMVPSMLKQYILQWRIQPGAPRAHAPPAVGFRRASFQAELHQWHELWRDKKDEEKPKTISEALGKCDKVFSRETCTQF